MKVLQVNATYDLGSTGTIVKDISECCEKNGIDCYVAYAFSKEGNVDKGYKIGNWFSNKFHALLSRISGKQGYFSYLPTLFFIRYLKQLHPDIVHLHNLHSNYINLPMLLKYLAQHDIRTIITLHDCWWYTGGCFHYTLAGCGKWLMNCGNCPKKIQDTPAYLFDTSSKILNDRKKYLSAIPRLTIVGVSDWISNEARKSFLHNHQILTIHNGIDLTVFRPKPSSIRRKLRLENNFIILGPASKWLQPYNKLGLEYFANRMKDDEVLLLYGANNVDYKLPSNVLLYGYTHDKEELVALYYCSDIFVNPSREDSLSLINIEAQACGTPVITFDSTGPKETVDGSQSHYIPVGDFEKMYNTVEFCRSQGINQSNIHHIRDKFDLSKFTKAYLELYRLS